MKIEYIDIEDLVPYVNNPKEHPASQVRKIAGSIRKFGFRVPLLVRSDMEVVAGHGRILAIENHLVGELDELLEELEEGTQRYETLSHINNGKVPCIVSDDMTKEQAQAFRIADNRVAESGWDLELLEIELEELKAEDYTIEDLGFEEEELDFYEPEDFDDLDSKDKYTDKIETPTYEPKGEEPSIEDLYDSKKTKKLIKKIEDSDIDEDLKEFLKLTARRHTKFDYENIAEFYAHQDKKVQKLMEDLTLVIIDYDQAIEQGFVNFAEKSLEGVGSDER